MDAKVGQSRLEPEAMARGYWQNGKEKYCFLACRCLSVVVCWLLLRARDKGRGVVIYLNPGPLGGKIAPKP